LIVSYSDLSLMNELFVAIQPILTSFIFCAAKLQRKNEIAKFLKE